MNPRQPKRPVQGQWEDDEEFSERLDDYNSRYEDYEIAVDMAIDEQRERDMEEKMGWSLYE